MKVYLIKYNHQKHNWNYEAGWAAVELNRRCVLYSLAGENPAPVLSHMDRREWKEIQKFFFLPHAPTQLTASWGQINRGDMHMETVVR